MDGWQGSPSRNFSPPWEITAEARIGTDRTLEVLLVRRKTGETIWQTR